MQFFWIPRVFDPIPRAIPAHHVSRANVLTTNVAIHSGRVL